MFNLTMSTIPRRLQASLIGIFIATYVATSVVVYSGARTSILEANTSALNQLAELKYQQLLNLTNSLATDLTAWSELEVMNDVISGDIDKRVDHALEDLKRLYKLPGDLYAFNGTGKLIASSLAGQVDGKKEIPSEWKTARKELILIRRSPDPLNHGDIISLIIPIFGSFDRNYRIGTLVMTYPWEEIEEQLFGLEGGTMLLELSGKITRLTDKDGQVDQVALDEIGQNRGVIVGRSSLRSGLIDNWQVVTWQRLDEVFRPLRRIAVELLLLGVFLAIPITILGRLLSRRLTAPIADLTRTVKKIADTDQLASRVPISSTDELGTLARAFNHMTESLEKARFERETFVNELAALNQSLESRIVSRTLELENSLKAQQRLIGDISHEIKSPLARLTVALGLAQRVGGSNTPKQFERMEKEISNISGLASELLTLARLNETVMTQEFRAVDLAGVVEQVMADAVYESPGRASDIALDKPVGPLTVSGNAELLRRSIENVVRNAVFYTTPNTPIEIVLRRRTPAVISVAVRDRGPGVPTAALPHLFEPFYRVDEARTRTTGGSGIGLAICDRAVRLHGGSVQARHNEPRGLIVEIELPANK